MVTRGLGISGPLAVTPNNNPGTPRQPFTREVPPAAAVRQVLFLYCLFSWPYLLQPWEEHRGLVIKAELRSRLLASGTFLIRMNWILLPIHPFFSSNGHSLLPPHAVVLWADPCLDFSRLWNFEAYEFSVYKLLGVLALEKMNSSLLLWKRSESS